MTYVKDTNFCPVHNTKVNCTYTFGQCKDAEVTVYGGCNCATCYISIGENALATYHKTYSEAHKQAKLAIAKVW